MAQHALVGIYQSRQEASNAVDMLREHGFRNEDISVLLPDNVGTKDFAHEKNTKAPEGAAAGAATGAVLGGAFGWLLGIGALFIPGVGPFVAAGPIVAAVSGVGVGSVVGGLSGALIGMGIPEFEAKRYEGLIKGGKILLSVHTDDSEWASRARDILDSTGAEDVSKVAEAKGDYANSERPVPRVTP
ncbi:MAG: general stress protein [Gemmatimonadota bacterium]